MKELVDYDYHWFGDYYILVAKRSASNLVFIGCKCKKHFGGGGNWGGNSIGWWEDPSITGHTLGRECALFKATPEEILMIAKLKQARL